MEKDSFGKTTPVKCVLPNDDPCFDDLEMRDWREGMAELLSGGYDEYGFLEDW